MSKYTRVYTPDTVADILVALANLQQNNNTVCEPSAGDGQIVRAILRTGIPCKILAVEPNSEECTKIPVEADRFNCDFEHFNYGDGVNKFIANPPFTNDIWLPHIIKMHSMLKHGGSMHVIVPVNPITGTNAVRSRFTNFLCNVRNTLMPLANWATNSDGSVTELYILNIYK